MEVMQRSGSWWSVLLHLQHPQKIEYWMLEYICSFVIECVLLVAAPTEYRVQNTGVYVRLSYLQNIEYRILEYMFVCH